jgi:two-component system chemotaxis sensor kinase CheA
VAAVSEEIERLTSSLRENSMNIRMMPIRATFEKFRRLVHDLARDLGKNVELTIEGADTELDKTVIDQLGDPLMHLIRNSMDHGIEPPDARASAASGHGNIHLSARHSGASVLIGSRTTAAASTPRRCARARSKRPCRRRRAADRGRDLCADLPARLFDGQAGHRCLRPRRGHGRGPAAGGEPARLIDVASKPGEGTSVTLRLPLTLAIIDGLLVSVGEAVLCAAAGQHPGVHRADAGGRGAANGKHLANVRGELFPTSACASTSTFAPERPEIEQIMVVETEEGRYGFVVDQVLGDCQTVIKNLGRFYRHVQVVSAPPFWATAQWL